MPKTPKALPLIRKQPYNLLKTRHITQMNPYRQASTRARTAKPWHKQHQLSPSPRAQTKPNRTTNKILSRRLGFYTMTQHGQKWHLLPFYPSHCKNPKNPQKSQSCRSRPYEHNEPTHVENGDLHYA